VNFEDRSGFNCGVLFFGPRSTSGRGTDEELRLTGSRTPLKYTPASPEVAPRPHKAVHAKIVKVDLKFLWGELVT